MPTRFKAQQNAAGAALSAKRGEQKLSELKGASRSMYRSMSEQYLQEMASGDAARAACSRRIVAIVPVPA